MDSRQEPADTSEAPATNYRVDRVFGPAPRARAESASQVASQVASEVASQVASEVASELLERRRSGATSPPFPAPEAEAELSLRRQLSRLQRQLAEAQSELANKDDELAAEIEKRLASVAAHERLLEQQRQLQERTEQLAQHEARTAGIEQRLQEAHATSDEMAQFLEREREARMVAQAKTDELTTAFEETRSLWTAERQMIEERTAAEIAQLEAQRKSALEATEQAKTAAITRLEEAHAAELVELKAGHERSMAALRGELEPRALEAHTLAEERERLVSEITALKSEAIREAAARDEAHARDRQQAAEASGIEQAAAARAHAAELAKTTGERDEQILTLQQSLRSSEALSKGLEEGIATLRETQLRVQRELAETKERASQLEANVKSLEERLALAAATAESLVEEKRALREQLESSASEMLRNSLDRLRFVAYLEEGLALLGALPPAPEAPDIETIASADETPS